MISNIMLLVIPDVFRSISEFIAAILNYIADFIENMLVPSKGSSNPPPALPSPRSSVQDTWIQILTTYSCFHLLFSVQFEKDILVSRYQHPKNNKKTLLVASTVQNAFILCRNTQPSLKKYLCFITVSVPLRTLSVSNHYRPPPSKSDSLFLSSLQTSSSLYPTKRADSLMIFIQIMSWNRTNLPRLENILQDIKNIIIGDTSKGMRLSEPDILKPVFAIAKLADDIKVTTSLFQIVVWLLEIDSKIGSSHLPSILTCLIQLDIWSDLNKWFEDGIVSDNYEIIETLCSLFILLSKNREVRLQKLPKAALDFLKLRTELILRAFSRFTKPGLVDLLLTHLSIMIGVHSECRWTFRRNDGVCIIMGVLQANYNHLKINIHCCAILNEIVEGILKRKMKMFKRKKVMYPVIVDSLRRLMSSEEVTSSLCTFLRKVIKLCPEDAYYLNQANVRDTILAVQSKYNKDAGIISTTNQFLMMFDSLPHRFKAPHSGRARSRSRNRNDNTIQPCKKDNSVA